MWAIVPLKAPHTAKSRLATVLNAVQRRELFFTLAHQVMIALRATPGITQVAVVTASDEVESFARRLGADVIRQAAEAGTAQACGSAIAHLRPQHLTKLLLIAGDLPLISAHAIQQMLDAADAQPGIVIAPDRRRIGTNALLCTPPEAIKPCFGADSYPRHLAAAAVAGVPVRIIELPELALDLDVAADLEQLRLHRDRSALFDRPLREMGLAEHSLAIS